MGGTAEAVTRTTRPILAARTCQPVGLWVWQSARTVIADTGPTRWTGSSIGSSPGHPRENQDRRRVETNALRGEVEESGQRRALAERTTALTP